MVHQARRPVAGQHSPHPRRPTPHLRLGPRRSRLAGRGPRRELSTRFAGPFLDGYVANRPLPDVDLEALPWLRMLSAIDNLKFHLIDEPAAMGVSTLSEGWFDQGFEALAIAAREAGLGDGERPHLGS